MDFAPEFPPRLGVDAGGRFVEEEQIGFGKDAGAERQPLFPAAGQIAGELVLSATEAEALDGVARLLPRILEIVDAGDEF